MTTAGACTWSGSAARSEMPGSVSWAWAFERVGSSHEGARRTEHAGSSREGTQDQVMRVHVGTQGAGQMRAWLGRLHHWVLSDGSLIITLGDE
jgi:hypothetical protein